jgi:hypothetical protein
MSGTNDHRSPSYLKYFSTDSLIVTRPVLVRYLLYKAKCLWLQCNSFSAVDVCLKQSIKASEVCRIIKAHVEIICYSYGSTILLVFTAV